MNSFVWVLELILLLEQAAKLSPGCAGEGPAGVPWLCTQCALSSAVIARIVTSAFCFGGFRPDIYEVGPQTLIIAKHIFLPNPSDIGCTHMQMTLRLPIT